LGEVINYADLEKYETHQKFVVFEYWSEKILGIYTRENKIKLENFKPHSCQYLKLIPVSDSTNQKPLFISSSFHILQGALELKEFAINNNQIQMVLALSGEREGDIFILLPESCRLTPVSQDIEISFTQQLAKIHSKISGQRTIILSFNF
jgi:hypothetical protein